MEQQLRITGSYFHETTAHREAWEAGAQQGVRQRQVDSAEGGRLLLSVIRFGVRVCIVPVIGEGEVESPVKSPFSGRYPLTCCLVRQSTPIQTLSTVAKGAGRANGICSRSEPPT